MMYDNDNEKTKKKKSFNIADVVIILLIVSIIGYIAYTVVSSYANDFFEDKYNVEYTVKLSGVMKDFENNIKIGDIVTETESLSEIGKVVDVKTSPSIYIGSDQNGKTVTSDNPLFIDIVITVEAEATLPDGIFTVNGYRITAGKDISLRVPDFIGKGTCTGIAEAK